MTERSGDRETCLHLGVNTTTLVLLSIMLVLVFDAAIGLYPVSKTIEGLLYLVAAVPVAIGAYVFVRNPFDEDLGVTRNQYKVDRFLTFAQTALCVVVGAVYVLQGCGVIA